MHEHRLIERLLLLVEREVQAMETGKAPDTLFIDQAVDFFKTYADRCHHGKEEDILFRELAKKPLSSEERRVLGELVDEHVQGRALVRAIYEANRSAARGGNAAPAEALAPLLRKLVGFYPVHIAKEDKHFFHPVMNHFTRPEMDAMLKEFEEFDRMLVHEKYAGIVNDREAALKG